MPSYGLMSKKQLDLVVPLGQNLSELLVSFQNDFDVKVLPRSVCHRLFYDTFDWLLFNSGAALELHEEQQSRRVYWRSDRNSRPRIQLGLKDVPQLANELPQSDFRRQLQAVVSVRELRPRIRIRVTRRPLVVLDANDQVAVRVSLDEHWYCPAEKRKGTVLEKRIAIKPVKGYKQEFSQVEAYFQSMQRHEGPDNLVELALSKSGKSANEYSSKLNLALEAEMPAEQAMKRILLRLLDIMQQNTAGCIRGRDPEFLHDYRVAIRKTRSALTQVEHVLPEEMTVEYNRFFSGLGKLTNPIRDLDVFQLKLASYQKKLKKSSQGDLEPLREYLAWSRGVAQNRFVATLKSDEYRECLEQWRDFLAKPEPAQPPPKNSVKPVGGLANQLIWNMYQLALEEGNAITGETGAEALHELRKTCKKLRYLMEFFQSLYPADRIQDLIQAMKGLQDNLGEYNDLHVHTGILKKFIKKHSDARAGKACKLIIKRLARKQIETRSGFATRFAAFASTQTRNEFRDLFADSRKSH